MILAPSLLSADAGNYAKEIQEIHELGAQYLHIDVMDAHFVPNLAFGPTLVAGIRKSSPILFDVHLMMTDPGSYYQAYIDAGADSITVHVETGCDVEGIAKSCKDQGILFGIAIKPATKISSIKQYLPLLDLLLIMSVEPGFGGQKFMPMAYDKIRESVALRDELKADYLISVDGGVNASLSKEILDAGADILVAGSAVFNAENRKEAIAALTRGSK